MTLEALLGIRYPLVQAPMAGVQGSALAIAVSNAGGLGSLPSALLAPDMLRQELTTIRGRTTAPFNVNFFCHRPPELDLERERVWRALLAPYYSEYGLDPDTAAAGPGRAAFDADTVDLLEVFAPPVVSFHFGLPSPDLIARVRRWGAKIMSSATTVDEARWLEHHGVDVIVAQGLEAGGHRGMFLSEDLDTQLGTFALVPQVVRAVSTPVVAAGGIADAAGVSAAVALGAAGVQVGTAYLLCDEVTTSPIHRRALTSATAVTAVTNLLTGRPARGIVNRLMRELGPINRSAPSFPLAAGAVAPLRARAESAGSDDFSPLWSGQNGAGCRAVSAAVITGELVRGFATTGRAR